MATIDEIKQQAEAVKNATQVGENTAERVGGALAGLAEIAEQQDSKVSDLSINTPFDNISLYKSDFIELKKEKYAYIRSIVKDIYVVLSDGDTNRYQITQLQIVNDKKIISIYTETDNGKFNNLALTVYDTDGNFIKKILRNKTIIYLYIDWEKLTNKNVVISEIGAFSNDISYIEHFGPIYDRLLLEQQNMLATNQNILAESFFILMIILVQHINLYAIL